MIRAAAAEVDASPMHHVVLDVDPALPPVRADERAVASVLANLLENAVKFSPDGGAVRVQAMVEGDDVVVSVSDEGVGLSPGDEERLFDQARRGTSDDVGLGLFIVQRLVAAQGGRVWANRHDGPGATFSFSLPRA